MFRRAINHVGVALESDQPPRAVPSYRLSSLEGAIPSYSHIEKISASGTVPVYKLHGSISWSHRDRQLVRYHDCRPAIRGDAAIVRAPFWRPRAECSSSAS